MRIQRNPHRQGAHEGWNKCPSGESNPVLPYALRRLGRPTCYFLAAFASVAALIAALISPDGSTQPLKAGRSTACLQVTR